MQIHTVDEKNGNQCKHCSVRWYWFLPNSFKLECLFSCLLVENNKKKESSSFSSRNFAEKKMNSMNEKKSSIVCCKTKNTFFQFGFLNEPQHSLPIVLCIWLPVYHDCFIFFRLFSDWHEEPRHLWCCTVVNRVWICVYMNYSK